MEAKCWLVWLMRRGVGLTQMRETAGKISISGVLHALGDSAIVRSVNGERNSAIVVRREERKGEG